MEAFYSLGQSLWLVGWAKFIGLDIQLVEKSFPESPVVAFIENSIPAFLREGRGLDFAASFPSPTGSFLAPSEDHRQNL